MRKWILPASLILAAMASIASAAPQSLTLEKRHVTIVTSELSFINYNGTYYLCDNDTPAEMTELSKNCIEISKAAFDYALNTTGADVMEMNIEVDKNGSSNKMQSGSVAPQLGNKKKAAVSGQPAQPIQPKLKAEPLKSTK